MNIISGPCDYLSGNITFTNTILYVSNILYMAASQPILNCIWRKYHASVPDLWLVFRAQVVIGWCQHWTGLKWGHMAACPAPGWVWPWCVRWKLQDEIFNSRPLVPSRREKKLLVVSKLWAPVSWCVQEGILAHPRGQIKLGRALGTNNLLFVQTSTSSTMRVALYCPLFLFSLVLPAAPSKIVFNSSLP